jgi:predicted transcriptional regulator
MDKRKAKITPARAKRRKPLAPARQTFEDMEKRRARLGVSLEQLCRRADVSASAVHRLRADPARTPNFRTINKLVNALRSFEGRSL